MKYNHIIISTIISNKFGDSALLDRATFDNEVNKIIEMPRIKVWEEYCIACSIPYSSALLSAFQNIFKIDICTAAKVADEEYQESKY